MLSHIEIEKFVSIIIPVFNDTQRLKKCLQALEVQTYPKDCYEIIVVNNYYGDSIEDDLKQAGNLKVVMEPKRGSYNARNLGVTLARGDILGFTDSDCIPNVDWIEKGVESIRNLNKPGIVAGRIELFFHNKNTFTLAEIYESLTAFPQADYIRKENFGATANIFVMKEVFKNVGLFLGALQSGGDSEWGKRVYEAGYEQKYADDMVVKHPARGTFKEMVTKLKRVIRGRFFLLEKGKFKPTRFLRQIISEASPFIFLHRAIKEGQFSGLRQILKAIIACTTFSLIRILLLSYYQTRGYLKGGNKSSEQEKRIT